MGKASPSEGGSSCPCSPLRIWLAKSPHLQLLKSGPLILQPLYWSFSCICSPGFWCFGFLTVWILPRIFLLTLFLSLFIKLSLCVINFKGFWQTLKNTSTAQHHTEWFQLSKKIPLPHLLISCLLPLHSWQLLLFSLYNFATKSELGRRIPLSYGIETTLSIYIVNGQNTRPCLKTKQNVK